MWFIVCFLAIFVLRYHETAQEASFLFKNPKGFPEESKELADIGRYAEKGRCKNAPPCKHGPGQSDRIERTRLFFKNAADEPFTPFPF
jgi:hypothetical protein